MLIADEEVPRMRAALGQVRLELETQRYVEALPAVRYPVHLVPRGDPICRHPMYVSSFFLERTCPSMRHTKPKRTRARIHIHMHTHTHTHRKRAEQAESALNESQRLLWAASPNKSRTRPPPLERPLMSEFDDVGRHGGDSKSSPSQVGAGAHHGVSLADNAGGTPMLRQAVSPSHFGLAGGNGGGGGGGFHTPSPAVGGGRRTRLEVS